ncbi:odorant receptor 22b-like [Aethina tumida]|uniref:odorant receptor 22b-like n=1 Tax=Aethina tumida TaxID=116153 RepID=UPI0021473E9C|nr:odorant receptor 22b-like [Aethina tumida]
MGNKNHLNFLKKVRLVCGFVDPSQLKYKNKLVKGFYRVYSLIATPLYLTNLTLMIIEMFKESDNPQIMGETLSYSTLYVVMYVSLLYIESKSVQDLYKAIDEKEEALLKTANTSIKQIYEKHTEINNVVGAQIFGVCGVFCICLVLHHIKIFEGQRAYVFYQWFPFNPDNYYWLLILDQVCYLSVALFYMMYSKLAVIAFCTYILAHIKVLQHFVVNIEHYAKYVMENEGIEDIHDARYVVIKHCVRTHNEIIEYIDLVRQNTSTFILLDFMLTSLQLGSILISLMTEGLVTIYPNSNATKNNLIFYRIQDLWISWCCGTTLS